MAEPSAKSAAKINIGTGSEYDFMKQSPTKI
jgi:hypothetical protein